MSKRSKHKFTSNQRLEVAAAQGWMCNNKKCKSPQLRAQFHIDHIVPLHLNGPHTFANWQALCLPCHAKKTAAEIDRMYLKARAEKMLLLHKAPLSRTTQSQTRPNVETISPYFDPRSPHYILPVGIVQRPPKSTLNV